MYPQKIIGMIWKKRELWLVCPAPNSIDLLKMVKYNSYITLLHELTDPSKFKKDGRVPKKFLALKQNVEHPLRKF